MVFIDDNSIDGTAEKIKELSAKQDNIKLLIRPKKMGLGSAYKSGLEQSSGNIIVEMDADLSHDPAELTKIVKELQNADIVVGSRRVKGGRVIGWIWHRRLIHIVANIFTKLLLGLDVDDSTSGFRVYKREVFKQIASLSKFDGFEFQVESLYIAKKLGLKVEEVPIIFRNRKHGTSKLSLRDVIYFIKAILKMKFSRAKLSLQDVARDETWFVKLKSANIL